MAVSHLPNKVLDQSNLKAFASDKNKCEPKKGINAFSPFPTMFSKNSISPGCLKSGLCGKGLSHSLARPPFTAPRDLWQNYI